MKSRWILAVAINHSVGVFLFNTLKLNFCFQNKFIYMPPKMPLSSRIRRGMYGSLVRYGRNAWASPGNVRFARRTNRRAKRQARFQRARGVFARARNMRIGGFLGLENKFYDTSVLNRAIDQAFGTGNDVSDPTTLLTISAPSQGDGESQRDGRKFSVMSAYVKGIAEVVTAGATNTSQVLVALVQDTQTNGAQLNGGNVFVNPSGDTDTVCSPFRNLQYSKRFRVLSTRILTLSPKQAFDGTSTTSDFPQKTFSMYHKFKTPMTVTTTGTTAGVSVVEDNSLHVIAVANGETQLSLSYNARIRFMG